MENMEKIIQPTHVQNSEEKELGILSSMENQIILARKLGNVYADRPEPSSFTNAMADTKFAAEYTPEAITKDEQYITTTRANITETNSSKGQELLNHYEGGFQLSEMMQAMVIDRLNNNWFDNTKTVMTSDYDDLRVGIDAVMKHDKENFLGIAFDFTVTSNENTLEKKLSTIWERTVTTGTIPTVKYFQDPDTKEVGRLLAPKFVVGASKTDVETLAKAYISDDTETLANHPFKFAFLLQIEAQVQQALAYYEDKRSNSPENKKFSFAIQKYDAIQSMIKTLKTESNAIETMKEDIELYEYTKNNLALKVIENFHNKRNS